MEYVSNIGYRNFSNTDYCNLSVNTSIAPYDELILKVGSSIT